ncbi:MAG: polysaccharide biosynthesis protein [Acidobacteriota bacterium]|nr:polysaccharide biosynthesis protein [Acidobacteriota bacterium]
MSGLKPAFLWLVQSAIFAFSGIGAFLLRFDLSIPHSYLKYLPYALPIWIGVKIAVFRFQRLDRGWWWFVSIHDVSKIFVGNILASAISAALIRAIAPAGFPRSLYFIDFLICFLATNGIRVVTRLMFDFMRERRQADPGKRIVIYGAGTAGITLLREIRNNPNLLYTVCGFVDDDAKKRGIIFQGLTVLGSGSSLSTLVSKFRLDEVLIALPSATGTEMAAILRRGRDAGVRCRTIPALAEIIEGRGLAAQIRDVDVADLLGRQPVHLDEGLISAKIENCVVMITGAAGSIGSELCRQAARFRPRAIIGFETAETPLFHLEREMNWTCPQN